MRKGSYLLVIRNKPFIMVSKSGWRNSKEILPRIKQVESEAFLKSLPIDKRMFHDLFDYLSNNLEGDCDDMTLTLNFLKTNHIENRANVIQWFHDHGAYCDREVLTKVAPQFQQSKANCVQA